MSGGTLTPLHENVALFAGGRSALTGARWLPVRWSCPRPAHSSHPTALENARRGPRGARRKALVTADASAPERRGRQRGSRVGVPWAPVRGHPLARCPASSGKISSKAIRGLKDFPGRTTKLTTLTKKKSCGLGGLCGSVNPTRERRCCDRPRRDDRMPLGTELGVAEKQLAPFGGLAPALEHPPIDQR